MTLGRYICLDSNTIEFDLVYFDPSRQLVDSECLQMHAELEPDEAYMIDRQEEKKILRLFRCCTCINLNVSILLGKSREIAEAWRTITMTACPGTSPYNKATIRSIINLHVLP
jgi:hypothetical protein